MHNRLIWEPATYPPDRYHDRISTGQQAMTLGHTSGCWPAALYSSNARWAVACSSIQSGSFHRIPLRPGTTRLGPAL